MASETGGGRGDRAGWRRGPAGARPAAGPPPAPPGSAVEPVWLVRAVLALVLVGLAAWVARETWRLLGP